MRQPLALLMVVVLSGTVLLLFGIFAFLAGGLAIAVGCLLGLPVIAALTTFRSSATPLAVALALSLPLAVLAVLLAANAAGRAMTFAMLALWCGLFGSALLSAFFGRYRRRQIAARRAHA
jgi:hypothetical protein